MTIKNIIYTLQLYNIQDHVSVKGFVMDVLLSNNRRIQHVSIGLWNMPVRADKQVT